MADRSTGRRRRNIPPKSAATLQPPPFPDDEEVAGESIAQDGGDPAVWAAFAENFRQVQSVLDRNRVLIQQVNENHQSKIHENMVKNVALIQEINGNITKVVSLYSDLSVNVSTAVHHHGGTGEAGSGFCDGEK